MQVEAIWRFSLNTKYKGIIKQGLFGPACASSRLRTTYIFKNINSVPNGSFLNFAWIVCSKRKEDMPETKFMKRLLIAFSVEDIISAKSWRLS